MKIIGADERLAERRGVKMLIVGPTGVGKTSLLRTLRTSETLLIDIEAGDLCILDLDVATIRLDSWTAARDLACSVGGPNKSFSPTCCYSEAHFTSIGGALAGLENYSTIFIDSITAASRLSYRHAEQQPEARTRTGERDVRATYGLHAQEMLMWLHQLQHAREKNVIFVGILEKVTDDFNRTEFRLQMEGQKVPREIGGIVDVIVTMDWIDFGDGKPTRSFVCTSPNKWGFPGKDRSGKLTEFEQPHLGKLITKILKPALPPEQQAQT